MAIEERAEELIGQRGAWDLALRVAELEAQRRDANQQIVTLEGELAERDAWGQRVLRALGSRGGEHAIEAIERMRAGH